MKLPTPSNILKFMKKPSYKPMRAREIARRLRVEKKLRKMFKKILKRMVKEGEIARIKGGRYALSNEEEVREIKLTQLLKKGKILGKFLRSGKTGVVIPRDERTPYLVIPRPQMRGIRSGSLVIAELAYPLKREAHPEGKVAEVIGKAGSLEAEKKGILFEYDLPEEFPREVIREAEEIPPQVSDGELAGRVDLRGIPTVTIDTDKAKDFDDAVSIEKNERGYRLWVSIADVSHYVKLGGALDNEALKRGTSVYLPERVIPMLPEKLSNWICSLVPNEARLTKTVEMEFDREGNLVGFKIYNSVIKSRARLTYSEVSEILEGKRRARKGLRGMTENLRVMKELYQKLRERRIERGSLEFEIPEPELIRDELGRTVDVVKSQRNVAHGMIEEFMIAANRVVAEFAFRSGVPFIYRIHEPPDTASIKELATALKNLGYFLHIDGKIKPTHIQRTIFEARGEPKELAVNTLILRSLKRAVYSEELEGHFGLAIPHYTHFTSPIRRYPDLIIHRIVNSLINGRQTHYDEESLEWIAKHSSEMERKADEVEREAVELERVSMIKSHIGETFEGFVISALSFGVFVELKEIFVEGFVPRNRGRSASRRRFEIGEEVRVKIVEADVEKRRITLELVE